MPIVDHHINTETASTGELVTFIPEVQAVLKKLRRMLGKEHLDMFHLDMMRVLLSKDLRSDMAKAILAMDREDTRYTAYYNQAKIKKE